MNLIDKFKSFVKLDFQNVLTNILIFIFIFYRMKNWMSMYYILHSLILNQIFYIDLNKMMP